MVFILYDNNIMIKKLTGVENLRKIADKFNLMQIEIEDKYYAKRLQRFC
jgi:hypothetical protein